MIFDNQDIRIYDVSLWQANMEDKKNIKYIDFEKLIDVGKAKAVIIKAGQRNYKDPVFDEHWKRAKEAGIPRGSYWFLDKFETAKKQAQLHWEYLQKDMGEGIHFCDFETGSSGSWKDVFDFMYEFQRISGLPNHKIGVYTGYYYWTENRPPLESQREWFAQYPLWVSWYIADPKYVLVPKNWDEILIWQNGTPAIGLEVGAWSKEIDHNYFNGNIEKFKKYFSGVENIPNQENKKAEIDSITIKLNNSIEIKMIKE